MYLEYNLFFSELLSIINYFNIRIMYSFIWEGDGYINYLIEILCEG